MLNVVEGYNVVHKQITKKDDYLLTPITEGSTDTHCLIFLNAAAEAVFPLHLPGTAHDLPDETKLEQYISSES